MLDLPLPNCSCLHPIHTRTCLAMGRRTCCPALFDTHWYGTPKLCACVRSVLLNGNIGGCGSRMPIISCTHTRHEWHLISCLHVKGHLQVRLHQLACAAAGQSQSDTSNTSMDSTDTATMHNREGVHPAGTHSNPIPSSVLSKPTWSLTPPTPPQSGQPALPTEHETILLTEYCNVLSFALVQSLLRSPHNERTSDRKVTGLAVRQETMQGSSPELATYITSHQWLARQAVWFWVAVKGVESTSDAQHSDLYLFPAELWTSPLHPVPASPS